MDKKNIAEPYNGILLSHEKEWGTDTYYNMHEPWKHFAKWNKPATKDHIDRKCPEQVNPQRQKVD